MQPVNIEYRIKLSEDKVEIFKFQLDGETFDLITDEVPAPPQWTELSFRQCSHCPLSTEEHSHCPMALQLNDIVERFHDTRSIDEVELEVITEDRRVIQTLAIQKVIASILELIVPICGCPKTAYMKPMSRFHMPLASEEETVFRVTGMYLLSQYFLNHDSPTSGIAFDGLTKLYKDLHIVNAAIASRLQAATQSDSLKNAITLIDMYSILVPLLLEDQLVEMRGFFKAYLPEDGNELVTTNYLEKAKEFSLELVPLEEELKKTEDQPDWLKEVTKASGSEATETKATTETKEFIEPAEEKKKSVDRILDSSGCLDKSGFLDNPGLKLELEPLDDETEGRLQPSNESDTSKPDRAVYKLPDDE